MVDSEARMCAKHKKQIIKFLLVLEWVLKCIFMNNWSHHGVSEKFSLIKTLHDSIKIGSCEGKDTHSFLHFFSIFLLFKKSFSFFLSYSEFWSFFLHRSCNFFPHECPTPRLFIAFRILTSREMKIAMKNFYFFLIVFEL